MRKRLQELNNIVFLVGTLFIEPNIRSKLEVIIRAKRKNRVDSNIRNTVQSEKMTPQIDVIANYCSRESDPMADHRPTVNLPLRALLKAGVRQLLENAARALRTVLVKQIPCFCRL